jgi:hypothetical protein
MTGRYSQCFLWTAYIFIYILSIRIYVIALPSFFSSPDFYSHSGFEEPRGTSTVRNEPGVLDITTCSVIP